MKERECTEQANEREGGERQKPERKNRHVIVSRGKQKNAQFTELHCLH